MSGPTRISDLARRERGEVTRIDRAELAPLPPPLDDPAALRAFAPLADQARERYDGALDGTLALNLPVPAGPDEERALVGRFLSGLDKLFERENNWTFLAAAAAHDGALREVPDLLRGLPHLRGERRRTRSTARPTAPRSCAASTSSTCGTAACSPRGSTATST